MSSLPAGYATLRRVVVMSERPDTKTLRRFFSRVRRDRASGCWEWVGNVRSNGYGLFYYTTAHRFAHQWFVGSIPEGWHVDHLCRNRKCVNPAHLEAVTASENQRRVPRTHCKQGHPRAIFWRDYKPFGKCSACDRIWSANHYYKRKEVA